ncbi:hypothetical protein DFA_03660 [Cavenderia fasciculata]|uniref:VASt domain-containing protein n=1 Tax=Cavenderia fasciculata TaxID=261658 RepID=F4PII2_CACFS|nr:uncharacterized protein DFA_03660 [Cavenderia fasciculata]EGG25411.1 hypothetical protein DFA_03660 [Cavenderia fasciculata]|eukprot:XP_004363262.1 hypothetical protein DFA_03660 [Cavenderia fasciculata]
MKSNPYIKKFKLPSTELLINDYSAALHRQILHHRLYLFTAKLVTSIKKKSKKFQFPVGIEIIANGNKLSIASFVSRDKTFNELMVQWKEVTGESHDEVSSHSIDDDEDESSNSVFEAESQSFNNNSNGSGTMNTNLVNGNGNQSEQSSQSSGFQQTVNNSLDHVNNNNNNNSNSNTETTPTNTTITNNPEQTNQQPTTECNNNNINGVVLNNNIQIEKPQQHAPPTAAAAVVVSEKSVFDELYGGIDQFLSVNEQSSILESQSSDFEELLTDNFNCSTTNFFRALCSDIYIYYHTKRGDKNISVKNWTTRERFGTVRELEYVAPVNSPIGPDITRIQETQRYHLTLKKLVIETDTIMLDIPYGDHFRIEAIWEVVETSPDTCRLTIQICESKRLGSRARLKRAPSKNPKLAAPSTVGGAALPSINITSLNRSIEKIRGDEGVGSGVGGGEGRIDSPKPHHSRSRSRQHLVSSSSFKSNLQPPPASTPSPINLGFNQNQNNNNNTSPLTSIKENEDVTLVESKKKRTTSSSPFRLQVTSDYGDLIITGYPMFSVIIMLLSLFFYMYLKINSLGTQVGTLESLLSNIITLNQQLNQQQHQQQIVTRTNS